MQKHLEESGIGLQMLTAAFRNFPKLTSVQIGLEQKGPLSHGVESLDPRDETDPDDFDHHDGTGACRLLDCGQLQFQYLISAGASSGLKIEHLKLNGANDNGSYTHPHGMHPNFMELDQEHLNLAKIVFAHVKEFKWILPDCFDKKMRWTIRAL